MYFVTPELAVGARTDAEDATALAAHGIEAILSLAPIPRPAGIARHLSMDIKDRVALPAAALREAVNFLRSQVQQGRRALVHCEMGISRSPSIAAGYMHEVYGLSIDEAVDQIREKHPAADPHPVLIASIRDHYRQVTGPVVDLSGNENPLGPSAMAMEAIRGAVTQLHRYPDKDATALRDKLAMQLGVPQEQIVLGNGSCELINHLMRVCLTAGDEALLTTPTFPAYCSSIARSGGSATLVPMPGGAYSVEHILSSVTPRTKLVVIATPHNPTGAILSARELDQLVRGLPERVWLLVDEAYRDYVPPSELAEPLPLIAAGRKVVVLRSLSKVYGLAGLRIGYGVAPVAMAKALDVERQHYNTSSLAQIAAVAALDDVDHVARTFANNRDGLNMLQRRLTELGVSFLPSWANFILIYSPADIVEHLQRMGVEVKPMERYGAPGHFRVSVGLPEENSRFLEALQQVLKESAETSNPNNQSVFA